MLELVTQCNFIQRISTIISTDMVLLLPSGIGSLRRMCVIDCAFANVPLRLMYNNTEVSQKGICQAPKLQPCSNIIHLQSIFLKEYDVFIIYIYNIYISKMFADDSKLDRN